MKYFIFTLGCQMNISDSEKIAKILKSQGHSSATENNADLIVINACSVRQKAVDRIWGKIKNWIPINKKIVITGCVLPSDKNKLSKKGIDYIDFSKKIHFITIPNQSSSITYITIMIGCDNYCSYCAVPYTRGKEKSINISKVISEAKKAINNKSKNILLLGQNVNSYKYGFAQLLKRIDKLNGDFQFNFMTSNPHNMTDKIIQAFSELKKWPQELHLAMQSGDDEILKKMNRKYTSKDYLLLVSKLKNKIPNIELTTDIIVGFPGETKKQFDNTVKICRKIGFKKAYISQYSSRPGTASAKLKDDVSPKEKKRRWEVLNKLINK